MDVIWKPVPNFEHVEVSTDGQFRNSKTKYVYQLYLSDSGYWKLQIDGKSLFAHKTVLLTFVGPPPSKKHQAAHDDGNKSNNSVQNLLWKTKKQNEADKKRHGTVTGGKPGLKRPSAEQIQRMIERFNDGDSITAIAADHGLHRWSVSRYVRGIRRSDAA
jgi:HNH endonuclease